MTASTASAARCRCRGWARSAASIGRPEGGHETWFSYTDHTTPPHVLPATTRATGETVARGPSHAGRRRRPTVVRASRSRTPPRDGTDARRMFVARRRAERAATGPRPDRSSTATAASAVPLTPGVLGDILAWVEAGGVYAVANLRGGGEEGEAWHRAGMLGHKQNVFDDFHAAAERLVADGWTTAGRLAISGGSNGGLLVGAALTQRPELYAAVVCSAPLLDMVRYEQFGLGATWNVEYGTRRRPRAARLAARATRRTTTVARGRDYPAVLFTVFDGDTRVDPLHARKMCAALQHATAGDRAGADPAREGRRPWRAGPVAGRSTCRPTRSRSPRAMDRALDCDRARLALASGAARRRDRQGHALVRRVPRARRWRSSASSSAGSSRGSSCTASSTRRPRISSAAGPGSGGSRSDCRRRWSRRRRCCQRGASSGPARSRRS